MFLHVHVRTFHSYSFTYISLHAVFLVIAHYLAFQHFATEWHEFQEVRASSAEIPLRSIGKVSVREFYLCLYHVPHLVVFEDSHWLKAVA